MKQDIEKMDFKPKASDICKSAPKTPPRSSPRRGILKSLSNDVTTDESSPSPSPLRQRVENRLKDKSVSKVSEAPGIIESTVNEIQVVDNQQRDAPCAKATFGQANEGVVAGNKRNSHEPNSSQQPTMAVIDRSRSTSKPGVIRGVSNGLSKSATPFLDFKEDKNISLLTKSSSSVKEVKTKSCLDGKRTQSARCPRSSKQPARPTKVAKQGTNAEHAVPRSIEKVGSSNKLTGVSSLSTLSKGTVHKTNNDDANKDQLKSKDRNEVFDSGRPYRRSVETQPVKQTPVNGAVIDFSIADPAASVIESSIVKIVSESKNKCLIELKLKRGVRPTVYNRSPHIELEDIGFMTEDRIKTLIEKTGKPSFSQGNKQYQGVVNKNENKHRRARTYPLFPFSSDEGGESGSVEETPVSGKRGKKRLVCKDRISMAPRAKSTNSTPQTCNKKKAGKKQKQRSKTADSQPTKRSHPTKDLTSKLPSSNQPDGKPQIWTTEEITRFDKARRNHVPSNSKEFWKSVSKYVGTRSHEECRNFQLQSDLRAEIKPEKKKAQVQAKSQEPVEITGGVGTMKRKRQLRAFVEHHNQGYSDDYFESMPAEKLKLKLIGLDMSNDDEFFSKLKTPERLSPIESPTSPIGVHIRPSWMPKSPSTPPECSLPCEVFSSAQRDDADAYIFKFKQRRKQTRKILPPKSGQKPKTAVRAKTSPAVHLPPGFFDIISEPDSEKGESEVDFYYSDVE